MKDLTLVNKNISLVKSEVYDETAEGTYAAIMDILTLDPNNKEAVIELLKLDYRLIHLLTKRYTLK